MFINMIRHLKKSKSVFIKSFTVVIITRHMCQHSSRHFTPRGHFGFHRGVTSGFTGHIYKSQEDNKVQLVIQDDGHSDSSEPCRIVQRYSVSFTCGSTLPVRLELDPFECECDNAGTARRGRAVGDSRVQSAAVSRCGASCSARCQRGTERRATSPSHSHTDTLLRQQHNDALRDRS